MSEKKDVIRKLIGQISDLESISDNEYCSIC